MSNKDTTSTPTGLSLYLRAAERASSEVIRTYSTSFGLASKLLAPPVRRHVENIYALVRVADEVVDGSAAEAKTTGGSADPNRSLNDLERETYRSLDERFRVSCLEVADMRRSPTDGTTKYLFRLEDAGTIEAVLLPEKKLIRTVMSIVLPRPQWIC